MKIGKKASVSVQEKKYYHVQFGDVMFYRFLQDIGLTPAKSRTMGALKISDQYFFVPFFARLSFFDPPDRDPAFLYQRIPAISFGPKMERLKKYGLHNCSSFPDSSYQHRPR